MTFAQVSPGYSCDPILSRRQREYNFSFIFFPPKNPHFIKPAT